VAFYFALQAAELKNYALKIRIAHDDKVIVEADANLELREEPNIQRHFANLIVPLGIMKFDKNTWLRVSLQAEKHEWVEVLKKLIFQADANSVFPNASSPPSLQ